MDILKVIKSRTQDDEIITRQGKCFTEGVDFGQDALLLFCWPCDFSGDYWEFY